MQDEYIELYTGNWLNNASVLGFLFSLEKIENKNIPDYFKNDGRVLIPISIFKELQIEKRYFDNESKISSIVTKAPIYRNYLQSSEKGCYQLFVKELAYIERNGKCDISIYAYNLPETRVEELKANGLENFFNRITDFNMIFHADLGPSLGAFPNAYWNMKNSNKICHLFSFLIIHQHLVFTELIDRTKIFINAPSFRLMYELNRLVSNLADKQNASYRGLLAMSVIEFSVRTNVMMNKWASMGIEIIAIKRGEIEFINLPYDTVRILANKKIAEVISSIGEFRIMNLVIDNKWKDLVELGYRILKISMKASIGKEDRNFINSVIYSAGNYQTAKDLKQLSNKILKLYALLQERNNSTHHEYIK